MGSHRGSSRDYESLRHTNCHHCDAIQQLTRDRDDLYRRNDEMRREIIELQHTADQLPTVLKAFKEMEHKMEQLMANTNIREV